MEKKFEAFLTCVIGDPDLKDFLEDLIDSNVLSVIYPPVKLHLVISSGDTFMVKISDGINSYVMKPNDIDDNMLQDIAKAYEKYKPDESEDEPFSDSETERLKEEFRRTVRGKDYRMKINNI